MGRNKKKRRQSGAAAEKSEEQRAEKKAGGKKRERSSSDVQQKSSDVPLRNKQKTLVFSTRGITARPRHLMEDIRALLPHSKKESKMDSKDAIHVANQMCEMKGCNNGILFEMRKRTDLFLWVAKSPEGPSVKFHAINIHTMLELNFSGNHLKGSRPLITFDGGFDAAPHLKVMKELLSQAFSAPRRHKNSKPFIDHVFCFSLLDNKIWFRNYQILPEEGAEPSKLVEVGPRFVLNPIKVFSGGFGGSTLWSNPHWVSPAVHRRGLKNERGEQAKTRHDRKKKLKKKKQKWSIPQDDVDKVFEEAEGELSVDFEVAE